MGDLAKERKKTVAEQAIVKKELEKTSELPVSTIPPRFSPLLLRLASAYVLKLTCRLIHHTWRRPQGPRGPQGRTEKNDETLREISKDMRTLSTALNRRRWWQLSSLCSWRAKSST